MYKYDNKGIVFSEDDNPLTTVRVYVDSETKNILDTLEMVTYNIIDEKSLTDIIIEKWIKKVNTFGMLNPEDIVENEGKETFIKLDVGERNWKNLSKACRNKCIHLKNGLKMSILNYIDEINIRN